MYCNSSSPATSRSTGNYWKRRNSRSKCIGMSGVRYGRCRVIQGVSRALNKVLFGARVESARDVNAQLEAISVAYVANLLMVSLAVGVIFTVGGRYDPFHAPLEESALRTILAISSP